MTLTGRVEVLENQVTFLSQDLLSKLDQNTVSELNIVWNQQFDVVDSVVTDLKQKVNNLQTLYTNLYKTVRDNLALFTGHTGTTGAH
jgi:archaellum component FlaC